MTIGIVFTPSAVAQEEFRIQSESMQEVRKIVTYLPENYNPDREEGYPILYMLDVPPKIKLTAEIASYYHWGSLMPELIVVGLIDVGGVDLLPHYYERETSGRQTPGNGRKLLTYIEEELIPFVDKQFNTNGNNAVSGHSWGGQFVTYALSQSPGLFDAYFITSPAFGDDGKWSTKTFDALEQTLSQDQDVPDLVYLSVGGDGAPGALSDAGLLPEYYRLAALLRQHLPEEVTLVHEVHDNANHTSNSAISIAKALQLYFAAPSIAE